MTDDHDLEPTDGISRRRVLVRGAVLGGVAWAAPAVTTVGSRAFGQEGSPPPGETDISFIALNVTCGTSDFFIKYEVDEGEFEDTPDIGTNTCTLVPSGTPADGDTLGGGFTASAPDSNGCITITVPSGCTVTGSAIKGGQTCCAGTTGTGDLVFCECP